MEADRRNISSTDETNCNKFKIRVLSNDTLYVLAQCNTVATSPIIKRWQIMPTQASGGAATDNLGMSQTVVDGKVKLCAPGCSDCSSGVCSACSDGYIYDSDSSTCFVCPAGCTVCSASDPNSCSVCIDGAYLSGTDCLPCDSKCITCSGSATSCQSCLPGEYYDGICFSCPNNCLNCTSNSTCTDCQKGFVVAGGACRKCSQSCSSCEATDITKCTSCSTYL